MKRDVDLCRQLLLDLEAKGSDCAVNILRSGLATEADDRLRYHLRLLIDAGFVKELVKEVDRGINGLASVRLTHAGIELLEVCRSDARWRDAKAVVLERTGGQSLSVIRTLLTKWAVEGATYASRRSYRPYYRREEAERQLGGYRYDRDLRDLIDADDSLRLVRTGPDYRERLEWRDRLYDADYYNGHQPTPKPQESDVAVQLPIYLV